MSSLSSTQQPKEAAAFLSRLSSLPLPEQPSKSPLQDISQALQPSIAFESELRTLFAKDRTDKTLSEPYVGLVDVHGQGAEAVLKIRQRHVAKDATSAREDDEPLPGGPRRDATASDEQHVLALPEHMRRPHGEQAFVDHKTFQQRFALFSENAFSSFTPEDWNNVFVAGGSVLACLLPVPERVQKGGKRALRRYFHEEAYVASDIDVFIYGLDEEQAKEKMVRLSQAFADSIPWDTVCVRTRHAVSVISQYPHRTIQIILRLYASPTEVLAGFDVDACSFGFDGQRVWATPRGAAAVITQTNTVDMTRRSPSYEMRLAKYADRGFEIYIPDLRRGDIDPSIYERGAQGIVGLARLLVLEKLAGSKQREEYIDARRDARGRPSRTWQQRLATTVKRAPGDWKGKANLRGEWMEHSTYESTVVDIPYGPKWDAARIQRLLYKADVLANSKWNPKTKDFHRLHRHSCFFGEMKYVLQDCCQLCPAPTDDEQKAVADKISENYVYGPITFMVENPGRQMMSGSFQPLDTGDWSEQAYLKPSDLVFGFLANNDAAGLDSCLQAMGDKAAEVLLQRDAVGRAPLHLALMEKRIDAAQTLLRYGARMTSRLVDGRTGFHLAAATGHAELLTEMLRLSAENEQKAEVNKADTDKEKDEDKSEEDEDEEDGDAVIVKKPKEPTAAEVLQEDASTLLEPDVIDINVTTWDHALPAIFFAVLSGSTGAVEVLVKAGAPVKQVIKGTPLLAFVLLIEDDRIAARMTRYLLRQGARPTTCITGPYSWSNKEYLNVLHLFTASERLPLLAAMCDECKGNANILDSLAFTDMEPHTYVGATVHSALAQALASNQLGAAAILLNAGASSHVTQGDWDRLLENPFMKAVSGKEWRFSESVGGQPIRNFVQPVEASLSAANRGFLLLDPNTPITASRDALAFFHREMSFVEEVRELQASLEDHLQVPAFSGAPELGDNPPPRSFDSPQDLLTKFFLWERDTLVARESKNASGVGYGQGWENHAPAKGRSEMAKSLKDYYRDSLPWLQQRPGANNSFDQVVKKFAPGLKDAKIFDPSRMAFRKPSEKVRGDVISLIRDSEMRLQNMQFTFVNMGYRPMPIPERLYDAYHELVQAVWDGDTEKVRRMTLPVPGAKGELLSASVILSETKRKELSQIVPRTVGLVELAVVAKKWDCVTALFDIIMQQYKPKKTGRVNYTIGDDSDYYSDDDESDAALRVVGAAEDTDQEDESDDESAPVKPYSCDIDADAHLSRPFNGGSDGCLVYLIKNGLKDALKAIPYNALDDFLHASEYRASEGIKAALSVDDFDSVETIVSHGVGFAYLFPILTSKKAASKEETHADYPGLLVSGKRKSEWAAKVNPEGRQSASAGPSLLHSAVAQGAVNVLERLLCKNSAALMQLLRAAQKGAEDRLANIEQDGSDAGMQAFSKAEPGSLRDAAHGIHAEYSETLWSAWITSRAPLDKRLHVGRLLLQYLPKHMQQTLTGPVEMTGEEASKQRARAKAYKSPLLLAFENGEPVEIVRFLLEQGADLAVRSSKGSNVLFAGLSGCKMGDRHDKPDKQKDYLAQLFGLVPKEVLDDLVKQQQNEFGLPDSNLLHLLSDANLHLLEVIRRAAGDKAFAELLTTRDASGRTPLMKAAAMGHVELATAMLEVADAKQTLRWEDATGDTAIERVEKHILTDSLKEMRDRLTIKRPLTFVTIIPSSWRSIGELRDGDGKFIITLDWPTIATRQLQQKQYQRKRLWALDARGQAEQLKYVLDHVQLSERLRKACQDILATLKDAPEAPEPLDKDTIHLGVDATYRRLHRILTDAQPNAPRTAVPVASLQIAAKARLDQRDGRYSQQGQKEEDE